MKTILETYFVETHEYDIVTGKCDLMEYWEYGSGIYESPRSSGIESPVHHSVLALAVM